MDSASHGQSAKLVTRDDYFCCCQLWAITLLSHLLLPLHINRAVLHAKEQADQQQALNAQHLIHAQLSQLLDREITECDELDIGKTGSQYKWYSTVQQTDRTWTAVSTSSGTDSSGTELPLLPPACLKAVVRTVSIWTASAEHCTVSSALPAYIGLQWAATNCSTHWHCGIDENRRHVIKLAANNVCEPQG